MAADYNIPDATYSGTDPDPVEWANGWIKPDIIDLNTRVVALEGAGGGAPQTTLGVPVWAPVGSYMSTWTGVTESQQVVAVIGGQNVAHPFLPTANFSADRVALAVVAAAAGTLTIGLYASNAAETAPGALLATLAALDTSTTGVKEGTISQAFTGGTLYWFVINSASTATIRQWNTSSITTRGVNVDEVINPPANRKFPAHGNATLPNPWPTTPAFTQGTAPALALRRSA